jgi:IS30 family transposase
MDLGGLDSMPGGRLTSDERAQIEVLFGQGLSFPQIAAAIGRDRSTVWREVTRNNSYRGAGLEQGAWHPGGRRDDARGPGRRGGAYRWKYSYRRAQVFADRRARRPKPFKLRPMRGEREHPALWATVRDRLVDKWSPKQVSRWLREEYPDRPEMWVTHETIYQAVFYQARGGMRDELARQVRLRSGRQSRRRQSRLATAGRGNRPWVREFHISTRPAEVEDRAVPGHWEGDLVIGARGSSAIITLVERATRYVMLGALPNSRVSEQVIDVLIGLMGRLPEEMRKTLTWDQGAEMAQHAQFTLATDCKVYFCDPHSPWQRGSNETPTDYSGSTSPAAAPTSAPTPNTTSTPSPDSSTGDPAKPWDGRIRPRHSTTSSLQQPPETAAVIMGCGS